MKKNKPFQSFPFFFSNAESLSAKKFSLTLEKSPILTFLNVSRLWENVLKCKGFQYIFFFKLFPEQACQLQCSPGRLNYRFLEMLNCCISITIDVIDSIDTILFHSHQFHNQLNSVYSMLWVFFYFLFLFIYLFIFIYLYIYLFFFYFLFVFFFFPNHGPRLWKIYQFQVKIPMFLMLQPWK